MPYGIRMKGKYTFRLVLNLSCSFHVFLLLVFCGYSFRLVGTRCYT